MPTGKYKLTLRSVPDCKNFLKLKYGDDDFLLIDEYIAKYDDTSLEKLKQCKLLYRGKEESYKDYIDRSVAFSERLELLRFDDWNIIAGPNIIASAYFAKKATDCLQNARFFTMKSALLFDDDRNIKWSHGYVPQFSFRCTYFGTATTWYSNTFDQLLQVVYWAYELYTSAKDHDGKKYDDTWDAKKTMSFCDYKFVIGELKSRGHTVIRKMLTSCFSKIKDVREWANFIKHKGGIEYLHLEAESPIRIYFRLISEADDSSTYNIPSDDRFEIKNFKSPIEVDIDDKIAVMETSHKALVECITKIIKEIDFDKYKIQFGGKQ